MRGAHHQDRPVGHLDRRPVLAGVELSDPGIQEACEGRDLWRVPERAGGDHHVLALDPLPVEGRDESAPVVSGQMLNSGPQPDGQVEGDRVELDVVRHLVLGREAPRVTRERQSIEAVELGRREEGEAVVVAPPAIADPLTAVDDEELPPQVLEVVASGQAGLAGADDQGLDVLGDHDCLLLFGCWVVIS